MVPSMKQATKRSLSVKTAGASVTQLRSSSSNANDKPTPSAQNMIVDSVGPISLVGGTAAIYSSLLNHPSSTLTHLSFVFMMLLAAQYALQPRLSRKYIPPQVNKQSVALVEEVVKTGMAAAIFAAKPRDVVQSSLRGRNANFVLYANS